MVLDDLRTYIQALEAKGELLRIKAQVDWDQEMGAIAEEAIRQEQPALLFENIRGHQDTHGRRVLTNTSTTTFRRMLTAVNLPDQTHPLEAVKALRQRCRHPLKPTLVSSGPCKEVIEKGQEVNLLEFPIPKWHGKDGGRYIQTWGAVITRDPQTGWVNAGNYRGMVHDRNKVGLLIPPASHAWLHSQKYLGQRSMPMAIALGCDPITPLVSCSPFPAGVDEYDIIGGIREKPLEVVRGETVDLPVPATAEIVLEGEYLLDPETFLPEGPFGEYPGYYSKLWAEPRAVFQVNCVTHRRDPIFQGYLEGMTSVYPRVKTWSLVEVIPLWNALEERGVPGITGVYGGDSHPTSHHIIFVSINKMYYGHERQVAAALWGGTLAANMAKFVVVVDSDVDITDTSQVLEAIANRVRPAEDIVVFPGTFGGMLDPSNSPELTRMTGGVGRWDRVLIDATWPSEWQPRPEWGGLKHPPPCQAEKEVLEGVRRRWPEYGFKA